MRFSHEVISDNGVMPIRNKKCIFVGRVLTRHVGLKPDLRKKINVVSIANWNNRAREIKKLARHSRESGNPVGLNKMHFCLAGFPLSRE